MLAELHSVKARPLALYVGRTLRLWEGVWVSQGTLLGVLPSARALLGHAPCSVS